MEMQAMEEIGIGEDLIPPLRPLAAVLHDSALTSHCTLCFSALPPQPSIPTFSEISHHVPSRTSPPLYCSLRCSSIDSDLHASSAELQLLSLFAQSSNSFCFWHDSSDLRLSLRLLRIFQNLQQECSLLSQTSFFGGKKDSFFQGNEKIECPDDSIANEEEKIEKFERIAGLMTNRENLIFGEIKKHKLDYGENDENILLRIKEGAKMMAKARRMSVGEDVYAEKLEGFALEEMVLCLVMTNAVEVQGNNRSSLGIAVYDATFSWINHSCSPNSCYRFLVGKENDEQQPLRIAPAAKDGDGLVTEGGLRYQFSERNGDGPRVVIRSVKTISKGEEVTIAYTDLLQPKETRQAELWSKYQFSCSCKRCAAVPTTYVDYALQASIVDDPKNPDSSYDEVEKLMQNIDKAITDYLSFGDSTSCCRKLEHLLRYEAKSPHKVKLHPCNHLSLSAYTTLASAYKVEAAGKLALSTDLERHKLEAFDMIKTSSAYSLLLAGAANHLFMSEPAIVTAAANLWINAGESLVNLARSSLWDAFLEFELSEGNLDEKSRLYNCIASFTPKVWSFLACYSSFLRNVENPVDLTWLESPAALRIESERRSCSDEVRRNVILLGFYCLRYGAHLSTICYGSSLEMNC